MPLAINRPPPILEQWQHLHPTALPPTREAAEAHAAGRLAQRPSAEVVATTKRRAAFVQAGLYRMKRALTAHDWAGMLRAAHCMKSAVHDLRISVRAENAQGSTQPLPPRAVQWQHARNAVYALAWANALDHCLQELGYDPGPLIALWNRQCCVSPVSSVTRYYEQLQQRTLSQDRVLLQSAPQPTTFASRTAQTRKNSMFHQGLLLDELAARSEADLEDPIALYNAMNYHRLTLAAGRLRVAILAYQHPLTPLPPHPEQYATAGGSWMTNRQLWRQAMQDWLTDVDETYPPAYTEKDETLPAYRQFDTPAPPYEASPHRYTGRWLLWPRHFLRRTRTF